MRATLIVSLAAALVAAMACGGKAESGGWPTRPIKVIVPFGPGSGSDLVARLLAPRLSERWGQPVVIDNRPGADGVVGAQAFASATDRHTLLFSPAGQVTLSPLLHDRLPYDPVRDLVPIAAVVTPSIGIAAAKDVGAASLADVVTLARQQPNRYLWAAAPGLPEVLFKAFLAIEKVEMKHVPYRDLSVAVQDLGAGRIHVGVFAVPTFMALVQSGAVKLLAALFGIVGYILRARGFEPAPLLLGFVLSPPLRDNLNRALVFSNGDLTTFITHPLSAVFLAIAAAALLITLVPTVRQTRASLEGGPS